MADDEDDDPVVAEVCFDMTGRNLKHSEENGILYNPFFCRWTFIWPKLWPTISICSRYLQYWYNSVSPFAKVLFLGFSEILTQHDIVRQETNREASNLVSAIIFCCFETRTNQLLETYGRNCTYC